ncbi:hypothetical protein E0Z10_g9240 [Xylaria hypoxylon]|uniref:DUF7587 domain-containing protein n=1 Tax=Xylaria hypoxylon TaxID=37992 RepID=A0A4Z0Y6T1_9PEZI|nr:hypothetical protein E0Z10_g9240 [Xylaria hypoxylon]
MAAYPILDRQTVLDRLLPPSEEEAHPWKARPSTTFCEPLLRVWDSRTASHPEDDGCMMSRAPEMRLDDRESRRTSLSNHLDYREWTPTPYISFTTSKTRVEDLVGRRRYAKRGAQMITVIHPNTRLRNGLPILDVKAEMDYYRIADPYRLNGKYYYDEYLCLWQVTAAEIVGHWEWSSLEKDGDWYQNTILPEFERFIETAAIGNTKGLLAESKMGQSSKDSINNLESSFAKLSATLGFNEEFNDFGGDEVEVEEGEEEDGGLDDYGDGYGYDTDDEVEEANAADDMIKIIEGDW